MSNVVTHSHKEKKKNNGAVTVIVTLLVIVLALFGLNYILNKSNKNNSEVVQKVADSSYTMGSENATVKLVEYSDFQCPACRAFAAVFPEVYSYINDKYGPDALSLTYKYFPLVSIHRNALLAAQSAEAARIQGKFWDLEKVLYEKQDEWGSALDAKSQIEGYVREMGIDMAKFIQDRDSQEVIDTVNAGLAEATKLGLNHTPTVFMNGIEMVDLELSADYIKKAVEDKLAELGVQPINQ